MTLITDYSDKCMNTWCQIKEIYISYLNYAVVISCRCNMPQKNKLLQIHWNTFKVLWNEMFCVRFCTCRSCLHSQQKREKKRINESNERNNQGQFQSGEITANPPGEPALGQYCAVECFQSCLLRFRYQNVLQSELLSSPGHAHTTASAMP